MKLTIIGAGGHASVVFSEISDLAKDSVEIRDDSVNNKVFCKKSRVLHPAILSDMRGRKVHVAIGDNKKRKLLASEAVAAGAELLTVVSLHAVVSDTAKLDSGCFIAAGAIVSVNASINSCCIVNHSSILDHDVSLGSAVHVAPGCVLGGGVTVGDEVLIGAGTVVLPNVNIGKGAVVGAGSVVTRNVPEWGKWIGTRLAGQR